MEFDEPEMESPTVEMSVDMEMSLIWKCLNLHLQRWAEETFTNDNRHTIRNV